MGLAIALFRGINVGGKSVLPMKDLVALLEDLGCRNVATYIQSGNSAFESDEQDLARLAGRIGGEIETRRGFKPYVHLLRIEAFEQAIAGNPFPDAEADPKTLHLGFLASVPEKPDLESLQRLKAEGERWALIGNVFYLHAPAGVGRSKLAAGAERLLGAPMTDRNWRTVCEILEMARKQASDAG
jgi:uncharacterized protein (DUF1697 family)